MLKVVIDSNIFVSAVISSGGNPTKVFDLVRTGKIKMVTSFAILKEVREVLLYPHIKKLHKFSQREVDKEVGRIMKFAKFTPEILRLKVVKDDPKDDKFIECAVEAKADFIVSGDHHLKDLKSYQGIKIVPPAEFLKIFNKVN
jgi:hypothetical protein